MIQIIWAVMILVGVAIGICTGQGEEVGEAAILSSKEAINLCVTMLGVMALWNGIMQVAKDAGLITWMSKGFRPIIKLLCPDLPPEHPAAAAAE